MNAQAYLEAVRKPEQQVNRLFTFLNARLTRAENGTAEIIMPISMDISQGGGLVSGGILATLADEVMGHAVISMIREGRNAVSQTPDRHNVVTVEMNIRYLRASDPANGGELRAEGLVLKPGRNIFFTEGSVFHSDGRLLAKAGASFWLLPPK